GRFRRKDVARPFIPAVAGPAASAAWPAAPAARSTASAAAAPASAGPVGNAADKRDRSVTGYADVRDRERDIPVLEQPPHDQRDVSNRGRRIGPVIPAG